LLGVVATLTLLFAVVAYGVTPKIATAAAGINHQINFQGKLVNPDGTNVTDGTYSIVFSIYNVPSSGSAVWTETQSVTLSHGIFQVNLGSVSSLPGSVDFNTDNIYLGIKVGSDAEMTPRIQFTSVPQAFNSEKLGGLGKEGFIQNTNLQQSGTSFNIDGTGVVGVSLTTPLLQAASSTALTITGNAASTWSTTAGNLTIQAGSGTVSLGTSTNLTASGALTVASGGATTMTVDAGGAATLNIGTANANAVSVSKAGVTTTVHGGISVAEAASFGSTLDVTGAITSVAAITGTTLNGTVGINTGVGGGTQRIDNSGNLVNIDNITANGNLLFTGGSSKISLNALGSINGVILEAYQDAESKPGFSVLANGKLQWGPGGSSVLDTNLYRSGADTLKTDDSFQVGGNATISGAATITGTATAGGFATAGQVTSSGTGNNYFMGPLGLGTTTPQTGSALTIANGSWVTGVSQDGSSYVSMFRVNSNNEIEVGANLNIDGGIVLPTDGGQLTLVDLPISSATVGTPQSYTFRVGSSNALTVYGESDGSGGGQNLRVAIGSSISPQYTLDVGGTMGVSGAATFASTLGVTGNTTLTTLTTSGLATLNSASIGTTLGVTGAATFSNTGSFAGTLSANATGKTALQIADSGAQNSGLTIGGDTNLYRGGADMLKTDDALVVGTTINSGSTITSGGSMISGGNFSLSGSGAFIANSQSAVGTTTLTTRVSGDSQARFIMGADGAMTWGSGSATGDTTLYRGAANTLHIDDSLVVQGDGARNAFMAAYSTYNTGTISQLGVALVGTGTTFTLAMEGGTVYYSDGTVGNISGYVDATHLTMSSSKTVTAGSSYTIRYGGFFVNANGSVRSQRTSTTAFQVQTAAGASVFNVDTTNGRIILTNGNDATLGGGGNIIIGDTTGANVVMDTNEIQGRNNGSADTFYINQSGGNVVISGGAVASTVSIGTGAAAKTITVGSTNTTSTTTLQAGSGGIQLSAATTVSGILNANATGKTAIQIADSGAQSSGITFGGDTNLYRAGANLLGTDDGLLIAQPNAGVIGLDLVGFANNTVPVLRLTSGASPNVSVFAIRSSTPADVFTVSGAGTVTAANFIANGNYSQNGSGTVSTGTGAISLNGSVTVASGKTFTVAGTGATTLGGSLAVTGSSTLSGNLAANGVTTFRNTTDSTTAFQVQTAAGLSLLNVDTTNQQITIGTTGSNPGGVSFTGNSGSYASTPDSSATSVTGDLDLIAQIAPQDWSPLTDQTIVAKRASGSTQNSYHFFIYGTTPGRFRLATSAAGTAMTTVTSTAAPNFIAGTTHWVRATWQQSSGRVQFFTSEDGTTWTQLGTDLNIALASIYDGTAATTVGSAYTSGTNSPLKGTIYRTKVYSGFSDAGGTLVADMRPSDAASVGSTSWTSAATSEIWTLSSSTLTSNTANVFGPNIATFATPTLFRNTANSSTAFQIQNAAGTNFFSVDTTASNPGITIGSDTNLYRSGTDTLQTDDSLVVGSAASTNSTSMFKIQNSGGTSLLNADTLNMTLSVNSANPSIGSWNTVATSYPSNIGRSATVTYGGYIYNIGGYDGTTQVNTVYSAKVNADGSLGTWTAQGTLTAARYGSGATVVNGYVYLLGGGSSTSGSTTVQYAKLGPGGTLGSWQTGTSLPAASIYNQAISANGYIYTIANTSSSYTANDTPVYSIKVNADGTMASSWTSVNAVPNYTLGGATSAFSRAAVTYANGYMYVVGGYNAVTSALANVYYAPVNSNGTLGTWVSSANTIPGGRRDTSAVAMNGYLYVPVGVNTAGSVVNTVSYAPINTDGSIGAWSSTTAAPDNISFPNVTAVNGRIYMLGTSGASRVLYYSNGSRLLVGSSLDLVGANGGNLAAGGSGGSITAGDITGVGNLSITGTAQIMQGMTVGGALNVGDTALFKNGADSTTSFQIQNSSGTNLFTADTSGMKITVTNLVVTANLTVNGHIISGGTQPTTTILPNTIGTVPTGASCTVSGTDTAGTITVTVGTSGATNPVSVCQVNFSTAFATAPTVIIGTANNAATDQLPMTGPTTTTYFRVNTRYYPSAADNYVFKYMVVQ
jgi:hypothetical protein